MKVILLSNVQHLGMQGDIKEVAAGYARNFLLPNRFAVVATPQAVAAKKQWLKEMEDKKKAIFAEWNDTANLLRGKQITLIKKVSTKGQLYAAVTPEEIVIALTEQAEQTIPSAIIAQKHPIKTIGVHEVSLRFAPDLVANIEVIIQAQEEEKPIVEEKPTTRKRTAKKS